MLVGGLLGGLIILNTSAASAASFQMVYNTPDGEDEEKARTFIQEEGITQTVSDLVENEFELRRSLSLFLGGDGVPRFDKVKDEIHMPYDFVFEVADRFNRDPYSKSGANVYDVTRDAYLHALLHQLSHALFAMYELRTSGDKEKAVDALTILLVLRYYENGGDIVLNAAELFVSENQSSSADRSAQNFWGEHQLDPQSYNQALCLVYGSDPQRYSYLRDGSEFLQIRDQECIGEYQRQTNAWFRVLESFLKRPPPA